MSAYSKKLTDEQVELIVAEREAGRGYGSLARRFGVSEGTILYHCLKHGAISPHQRQHAIPIEPSSFTACDGRIQRRFTQADDAQMLALEATGASYWSIARQLGRAYSSVRYRLLMLAAREDMPA